MWVTQWCGRPGRANGDIGAEFKIPFLIKKKKKVKKKKWSNLFNLDAVRTAQVTQASLHQVGQESVHGLVVDVVKLVVTARHQWKTEYSKINKDIQCLHAHTEKHTHIHVYTVYVHTYIQYICMHIYIHTHTIKYKEKWFVITMSGCNWCLKCYTLFCLVKKKEKNAEVDSFPSQSVVSKWLPGCPAISWNKTTGGQNGFHAHSV